MGMGALASLVSVANASDAETQRCIAYSLCNLAATDSHRRAIVTEGGLVPIVALACSEDEGDQLAAHSTLRALASDPLNRVAIVREGALEALCESGSKCTDVNVLIEVAQCACALGLAEKNKTTMSESELLPVLVRLASHTDPRVASFAAGALANLAENVTTHASIVGDTRCVERFCMLVDPEARRGRLMEWLQRASAGRGAIEGMLKEREDAGGLARPGGPGAKVVDNVAEAETAVQRLQAALVGQATAGGSASAARAGRSGSGAASGDRADVAALAIASGEEAKAGAAEAMSGLDPTRPGIGESELGASMTPDETRQAVWAAADMDDLQIIIAAAADTNYAADVVLLRRECARCIANLATRHPTHGHLVAKGIFDAVALALGDGDPGVRHFAAMAASNLTTRKTHHERACDPRCELVEKLVG